MLLDFCHMATLQYCYEQQGWLAICKSAPYDGQTISYNQTSTAQCRTHQQMPVTVNYVRLRNISGSFAIRFVFAHLAIHHSNPAFSNW